VVAHARCADDDDAPVIYRDSARTAADRVRRERADGDNWWRLIELWQNIKTPLLGTLPGAPLFRSSSACI
jgi:hypothetical protein